jgi:tetratricopeptide (TPR) repeat protein
VRKIFIISILLGSFVSNAQNQGLLDSINRLLEKTEQDTTRVDLLLSKGNLYYFIKPDSARIIIQDALELSKRLKYRRGEVTSLNNLAETYRFLGNYPLSLKLNFEALQINRQMKDIDGEAMSLGFIGFTYVEFREYRKGLEYSMASYKLNKQVNRQLKETFDLTNIANAYNFLNKPDSGLYYSQLSLQRYTGLTHGPLRSLVLSRLGNAFAGLGKPDSALKYYKMGLANSIRVGERVKYLNEMANLIQVFFMHGNPF